MAFFKKLRDRMFKSSSKLEEGLEAIVRSGEAEPSDPKGPATPAPSAPPSAPDPAPSAPSYPAAPQERIGHAPPGKDPGQPPSVTREAEGAAHPAPDLPRDPSGRRAERPDAGDLPPPPVGQGAEGARQDAHKQAEAPASPRNDPTAEVSARRTSPPAEPGSEPDEPPLPSGGETASARPGLLGRLLGRGGADARVAEGADPAQQAPQERAPVPAPASAAGPVTRRVLDDEMLESLEELLIASDMGVDTALRVAANLAEGRMGRRLSSAEIKGLLADEVARIMDPVAKPMPLYSKKPQVVLVVGVNGSGKTTTIGKLASQFRAAGKSVVIAAGDTFRAAAVEQLQVWGDRAGVPVMTAPEGSDPASLAFDAMARAEADGADLLMIDTAGRLQNRADLMEELAKIVRVIRKRDPDAPHNTLLVLDATTGQNALSQVETFQKLADVSGLVMTKLDGTARGGVLVALADRFGLPIHAIGVGEQIDDLAPFDPEDFARALTGVDT